LPFVDLQGRLAVDHDQLDITLWRFVILIAVIVPGYIITGEISPVSYGMDLSRDAGPSHERVDGPEKLQNSQSVRLCFPGRFGLSTNASMQSLAVIYERPKMARSRRSIPQDAAGFGTWTKYEN
jgi:hypothetical protein